VITLVRVDDRLLHGQVIHAWVPATRSDTLIVVADLDVHYILRKELSYPAVECDCEIKVLDAGTACSCLKEPALEKRRVMVILPSIAEAERIHKAGFHFTTLNIGNIHHAEYKTKLSPSAMITEAEERALKRLKSSGVTIDVRALPETRARAG